MRKLNIFKPNGYVYPLQLMPGECCIPPADDNRCKAVCRKIVLYLTFSAKHGYGGGFVTEC